MRWTWLLVLYVLCCSFLLFLPLSLHPASLLPDDGDALQATWMMAWVAHQFPEEPSKLFDANGYFPHPRGLVYSEHFLPQGLLVGAFMKLGANLVLAYNLLALAALALIAMGTRFLARELGLSETGALAAGAVAAFTTFNLGEVARLHILFMPWIPLGIAALHRFFRTGSTSSSVAFATCFLLQGLASHYYLVSLPLFLAPLFVALALLFPERRSLADALRLGLPLAIACLLFVPIELPYLETFRTYRFQQTLPEGTDLARYLVPPANNLLYGDLAPNAAWTLRGANEHFLGVIPLLLALAARRLVRAPQQRAPGSVPEISSMARRGGARFRSALGRLGDALRRKHSRSRPLPSSLRVRAVFRIRSRSRAALRLFLVDHRTPRRCRRFVPGTEAHRDETGGRHRAVRRPRAAGTYLHPASSLSAYSDAR